jgi:hypothetical protein
MKPLEMHREARLEMLDPAGMNSNVWVWAANSMTPSKPCSIRSRTRPSGDGGIVKKGHRVLPTGRFPCLFSILKRTSESGFPRLLISGGNLITGNIASDHEVMPVEMML